MDPRRKAPRTLPCGEDVAPDVRADGPAYHLMVEHWRRLDASGYLRRPERAPRWPYWDADDYSRDAPESIPAGSCQSRDTMLGIEQRTAGRE